MPHGDWRSRAAYDSNLDAPDFAWEALRRYPEYRSDYERAQGKEALGPEAEVAYLARRWGLTFSGGSAPACLRAACVLAARAARPHGDSDPLPP
ncbi:transcriptional regulator domain-containing protein [Inquilinus limosus]|uniref:transcriptional regulator domain-containing protein n=1 Tax=Inquilinus limosus TaxID=171674 RepID=UPI003F5CDB56